MATEIQMWEVEDGKLIPSEISMIDSGRREVADLEKWIKNNPEILGEDILLIGEQVQTKRGPLDFLGIDKSGNLVIIELKRDKLHREVLAQAIDYTSDIASWEIERLNSECEKYTGKKIGEYLIENFDLDERSIEEFSINTFQKILLVGMGVDESLQRMVEWLSNNYDIGINILIFKYTQTKSGDEIIARTMIISEEVEKEKSQKHQRKIHAERYILRKEFWTKLLEKTNQKTNLFSNISPTIYSWISTGAGKSGISYNFSVGYKYARCEIYLDAGKGSEKLNKERFDKLKEKKDEIENIFGNYLNWERSDERRFSRISFEIKEAILRNKEKWDEMQEKMLDIMIKLVDSTKEYIKDLE